MTQKTAHPELAPGEVLIGNMFSCDFSRVGWATKRMGRVAYETGGKRIPNFRPVFVQSTEIEAAQSDGSLRESPTPGTIDHRW